jgi:hypothetical protein
VVVKGVVLDDSGGRGAGGAVTGLERTVIQLRNSAAVYIVSTLKLALL